MSAVIVEYKRIHQLQDDGEYPFTGSLVVSDNSGEQRYPFIGWSFKRVVGRVSELLTENEAIQTIILQRTDKDGIRPIHLDNDVVKLIRTDPVAGYRILMMGRSTTSPIQRTAVDIERFSDIVYVELRPGQALCPIAGEYKGLAYGERHGWRIVRDGFPPLQWVPLEYLEDSSIKGMNGIERLVLCTWAAVNVQRLLDIGCGQYYLPRTWNIHGPWIDHAELEKRLCAFNEGERETWHQV